MWHYKDQYVYVWRNSRPVYPKLTLYVMCEFIKTKNNLPKSISFDSYKINYF